MAATEGKFVVLLAIDRSEQAKHAFDYYVSSLHNANHQLLLCHVPEGPTVATSSAEGQRMSEGEWQKMKKKEQKETEELLKVFSDKMNKSGIKGEYVTQYGHKPGETICEAATSHNAKLVVMGTRGLGSFRRTIMGSVSDYVLHHAHVPVIICRQ